MWLALTHEIEADIRWAGLEHLLASGISSELCAPPWMESEVEYRDTEKLQPLANMHQKQDKSLCF